MNIVALLPWWAGVALAAVAYFWLHSVASQDAVMNMASGQIAASVTRSAWKAFASIGQYLVPAICLAGAGVSAFRRHQRKTLVADVASSTAADALDGITWQDFELLVGESFRLQGYQVTETGGGGADGGIDLVLRKGSEKFLVQCKQWKAFTVGVTVVRELYGVMAAKGAAGGFVVTSGKYTKEAKDFAAGCNIKLIDGPTLMAMIKAATEARGGSSNGRVKPASQTAAVEIKTPPAANASALPISQVTPNAPAARPTASIAADLVTPANPTTPTCPVCAKAMVLRTAKKGASAGKAFWGCSGYPSCRGTRQS